MKDIYICAKCGFVSTIAGEFVRFGGEEKSDSDKYYCVSCAYIECEEERNNEATK